MPPGDRDVQMYNKEVVEPAPKPSSHRPFDIANLTAPDKSVKKGPTREEANWQVPAIPAMETTFSYNGNYAVYIAVSFGWGTFFQQQ